jgi:hypothetical protein
MALELYIEDELIDLIGDEQISTDYAIAEIGNFATRSGFRSINFDIPKTANNNRILQNAFIVNNTTTRPYRRLKARVFVDGIDQNIRFADIESVQDTYNMRLYGGNVNFFELIKGNITDLDLNEYDHYWTLNNAVASRTNTTGFIYPIIDYFIGSPNNIISNTSNVLNIRYVYASVFLQSIIEKIVTESGYTLNDQINASPIIIAGTDLSKRNKDGRRYLCTLDKLLTPPFNEVPSGIIELPIGAFTLGTQFAQYYSSVNDVFDFVDEVIIEVAYNFVINNAGSATSITFGTIDSQSDGSTPALNPFLTTTVNVGANTFSGTYTRTARLTPSGLSFSSVFVDNGNPNLTFQSGTTISITKATILESRGMEFGSYITVNSILGNLKQSDIIKYYLQKACGLIQVNEDTKVVTLVKFDTLLDNIPQAVDWSDKIDYTEENKVEFSFDEYGQSNELNYKADQSIDDVFIQGANGTINIDDETLELDKVLYTAPFSATEMDLRLLDLEVPKIKIFEQNEDSPPIGIVRGKVQPRVLYIEKVSGDIDYTNGVQTTTVNDNIPLCWFMSGSKTENLGFGNNLIERNYQGLIGVLTRTKIVTEQIRLNALDIQQLDFLKPVFLSKHNAYFYISKISGFTYGSSESTEVELVKLR